MTIDQTFQNATDHHRAGRLAEAEQLYRAILTTQPDHTDTLHRLGILYTQTQRYPDACQWLDQAITLRPSADLYNDLAVALIFLGESPRAITSLRQAIALNPNLAGAHTNLGTLLQQAKQFDQAIAAFKQAISLQPNNPQPHFNLGNALMESGNHPAAIDAFNAALQLKPDYAAALINLASAHRSLSRPAESADSLETLAEASPTMLSNAQQHLQSAAKALRQAIQLNPRLPQAISNLGNVLCELGEYNQAIDTFRQAIALQPNWPDLQANLSRALRTTGDLPAAIAAAKQALSLQPQDFGARESLARALQDNDEIDPAIRFFQQLAAEQPHNHRILNAYANVLRTVGHDGQALDYYQRAHRAKPSDSTPASNYLFALQFQNDDPQFILAEHRKWNDEYAERFRGQTPVLTNDRQPNRRLRIGYVSPHFNTHVLTLLTTTLLSNHNKDEFEIFCYSTTTTPDKLTERVKTFAHVWRDVALLGDREIAEQIIADRIDILVDLAMHLPHCRPLIFAQKPAPIQAAWIAYPGTTGIWSMDYRLTDPHLDPPGFEDRYTEKTIHLPDTFWCYNPHVVQSIDSQSLPHPNELPATRNGFITFGCLNEFAKLNPATIHRWARLMQQTNSRLHLLSPRGSCRDRIRAQFASLQIEPHRIEFIDRKPRSAYLTEYHRIDLCLDTLPYNGHTTSLDGFWMGVPVLTQIGKTLVGRAGLSQLSNLKLDGFTAQTDEQFIQLGTRWASDFSPLADLRRTLRDRMEASPLMDGKKFARGMEAAFRQMWTAWCNSA